MKGKTLHLNRNDVPASWARIFPEYRGTKFSAVTAERVRMRNGAWAGGSRSWWRVLHEPSGQIRRASQFGTPFDAVQQNPEVPLSPGIVLAEHVVSQGRDLGIRFHVHPDAVLGLLPCGPELAPVERDVLEITASYISSYRKEEARRRGISRQQWDDAKAALIGRGLLRKNGAITIEGRNAIAE